MFLLSIGVLAGVLLVYLWQRAQTAPPSRLRSWRWLLAGIWSVILLAPMISALRGTIFSPYETMNSVLFPWGAGLGLGIWAYLIIEPLSRGSSAGASAFIPFSIAMLFAIMIVSEERYGWFTRLQKISFGGGGIEFAPSGSKEQQRPNYAPGAIGNVGQTGETRVALLVEFMKNLRNYIERDKKYADALEPGHDSEFDNDAMFAEKVIVPLGERLDRIHDVRSYNQLGLLIERGFVDDYRTFIQSKINKELESNIKKGIMSIWFKVCEAETRLSIVRTVKKDDQKPCNIQAYAATASMDLWTGPHGRQQVSYALPYGVLFAGMLLNAAGEIDAAVMDLDRWIMDNWPKNANDFRWVGIYRALNQINLLLMGDNGRNSKYDIIAHSQKQVELGERLLSSSSSWREQREIMLRAVENEWRWGLGDCARLNDLFKIFMTSYLSTSNNLAYYLSQNVEFAEHELLKEEMERRANFLITKIDMRCLITDSGKADSTQASYFDTAAAVEFTLALKEKVWSAKRRRLCTARKHAERAIGIYWPTLPDREATRLELEQGSGKMVKQLKHRLESYTSYDHGIELLNR